ncbi:hypothetical protein MLD38_037552 [Melastoma candidum]|uniref:Uncharacterized protein n=1 Tax=Melastoma candidum TaxID=119954 RepID=A0ACB9LPS4_9MYRT|nr:hypothetical protein MLD38_037552 [Melastoma candidum]
MDGSEVVIIMLIGKLREVMSEGAIVLQELQEGLSKFIEQLQEMLKNASGGWDEKTGNGHLREQCKNVVICARDAEDIADSILLEASSPSNSKKGLFLRMVYDLTGCGDRQARAKKLMEKLMELLWHYTKMMQGRLLPTERWSKVYGESRGSGSHRDGEDEMKLPLIVGRDDETKILIDQLKKDFLGLRVISVTGEEGIGKTALVRSVYDCSETKHSFSCRAWISSSKTKTQQHMLVELIKQSPELVLTNLDRMGVEDLRSILVGSLTEYRYLIVLDDWKDFKLVMKLLHLFRDSQGSRVIVTSQEDLPFPPVATWVYHLPLKPLKNEDSKTLLGNVDENEATEILNKCAGSPLKLILCRRLVMDTDARSSIAKCVNAHGSDWNKAVMHLTYTKLSPWVKPCLLYLCLFPKGSEIRTRRAFQLWYAEGLARRNGSDTAEACLQELVSRNIVQQVKRRKADKSLKTFSLPGYWHDYLLKFATNFGLLELDVEDNSISRRKSLIAASPWVARCLGTSNSLPPQDVKTTSRIRSYISFKKDKAGNLSREVKQLLKPLQGMRDSMLLRVLDLEGVYKPMLPENFGDLLPNLRYLGLRWTILDSLPKSVVNLSKLETLDLKHTEVTKLPGSILTLKNLRHLYLNEVSFDDDVPLGNFVSNLETLLGLSICKGSHMLKVLGKFKVLRKLGLTCHSADVWEVTDIISTIQPLELLRLRSGDLLRTPGNLEIGSHLKCMMRLSKLYLLGRFDGFTDRLGFLPENLRILTLSMSRLEYDPMSYLGQLRNLVGLNLLGRSFTGRTITCPRTSFPSLRELRLWKLDQLREIRIEDGSMKSLEELEIRGCQLMRKIEGLNYASNLKHVKLTNVREQFFKQLRNSNEDTSRIITSRESIVKSEASNPEDCPDAEVCDIILQIPSQLF